ncbi:MAG TPA: 50S ribosomal protein L11 methyltransferase [Pyrinomonadaceae bacterium]|nr:50S ribosomal protein L11 methyltransferase [Pyrinomonadaceae bacterium]
MKWESVTVPAVERWFALDVTIEAEAREAVDYALMEAGALGTQFDDTNAVFPRITAYFALAPDREAIRTAIDDALRIYSLPSSAVRETNLNTIENQDWLGEWKKTWQPIEVGERLLIAPPWSEIDDAKGRVVIRIEPGMAFGTGTHETTRLCLRAIEKYFAGGSFLDVGTGTGVLAIAAAKLFPAATIIAYDTDAEAIEIAKENARLNGVDTAIDFLHGSVDETTASANLVCANLTAPVIVELLPLLVGASCGRLVLSGVLESQLETIREGLGQLGINDLVEVSKDDEWVAIVV